ncbi:phosphoribosylamine--glycine ligase [Sediminibacillus dalangtanensis]|uniref:Phosphoribosylamine--glycine ligase n=1 Tax=Sediminibacillus dalangtanensis TaxID=2729421 RepID=A0ABX7VN00_9BACI|nr:phosphoribosylamine--glycine ligase [Sediminibacillus dalangtanensis]QTM98212.1 phosphoribosylamine--glycine ligase [Sediminibacillus dalangtanensis]
MNVLVIGSGGREHSMVKKLKESKHVDKLYAAPGNGGICQDAQCVPIKDDQIEELAAFAKETDIDWTIVGPENPLAAGIVNAFEKEQLQIFGPAQEAAIIEGSKDFAKGFMDKYGIPTAAYQTFTDADQAKSYIRDQGAPIVIKADGLAAGKGVVVAETLEQALVAVDDMLMENEFGNAGSRIVVEEFLEGKEFSLMAFVNGSQVYPMIPARDHKRAHEGDRGPNTGGMGAYAPIPELDAAVVESAISDILKPAAAGMAAENRSFSGVLYAGLIETPEGPKVIEFNARMGDPETQVVLPLLENDLLQVIIDVKAGKDPHLTWKEAACIGTVVASAGYPGAYEKSKPLPALNGAEEEGCFVIHAGTKQEGDQFVSAGGRVLLAGSLQKDQQAAQEAVYSFLKRFDGNEDFFYRRDIGFADKTEKA